MEWVYDNRQKGKGILRLMRIGLICLKASVYPQERL
jgi:hypothetical protein